MSLKDRVAIIIVTYNGEKWLSKCLKPLYGLENLKIVVVDNFSTDNTVNNIKKNYPNVELILSPINLGFGQANNKGFEYAIANNYDYVFLLNQDASIDIDSLVVLIDDYKNDLEIGILSPVHFKSKDEVENLFQFYLKDSNISNNEVGSNIIKDLKFVNAALWLISVKNLKKIGGFNPLFFHYGEDVDFVNRVKFKKLYVKANLSVKGFHYRNYTKESFKKNFDKSRYFGPWNIKYYTILTNVNNSEFQVFFEAFKLFFKNYLKYLSKGYFSSSFMCVKVYFNVLKQTLNVLENRKRIKFERSPFLTNSK